MSLNIQIGNESLDLLDVQMDITEENPFLQLGEQQQGEYSLPFDVPMTEKNNRLLGYVGQIQKRKTANPTSAIVCENGIQHSQGNLNIESLGSNLNRTNDGSVSLYYTFGLGSFFNLIKDKRLSQVNFGAAEQYLWEGETYTGGGFWAHVHRVMHSPDPAQYNYAIFPAKNISDYTDWADIYNMVVNGVGTPYDTSFIPFSFQRIVPFPYLRNVLIKTFAWLGWTIEGPMLNDAEFKKICLLNTFEVSWHPESQSGDPINIDLALQVPDVLISTFLLGLRVRFGWWYDFDFHKKKCTVRYLSDVFATRNRIDQTLQTSAPFKIQIQQEKKIYSLQASQEGEPPKLSGLKYQGTIAKKYALPAADSSKSDQVYFVASENNFYICLSDDLLDSNFSWQLLSSNAVAFTPDHFNDTITTACNIPVMIEQGYFGRDLFAPSNRNILLPQFSEGVNNEETDDFFICYAHGDVLSYFSNAVGDTLFPYGSPHNYDPNGNKLSDQTLSWEFIDHETQIDIGIAVRYWKDFLKSFVQVEVATFIFYLPFDQAQKLTWMDSHIIRGTEWMVKTRKRNIPYSGFIECTCIRI